MIRFVYIGDQVVPETREFCFYDTIIDKFISFNSTVTFDSLEDFKFHGWDCPEYNRCFRLIPDWYIAGKKAKLKPY